MRSGRHTAQTKDTHPACATNIPQPEGSATLQSVNPAPGLWGRTVYLLTCTTCKRYVHATTHHTRKANR